MDEAKEDDGGSSEPQPGNATPDLVKNGISSVLVFLESYGWLLLLAIAIVFYVQKRFSPTLANWKKKREEQSAYAFDASVSSRRHESMEAARKKLQDQLNTQAEAFKEKQKQLEEEKRQAKIQDWDRHQEGKGYRSKIKAPEESTGASTSKPTQRKKQYRPDDYSPLMGGGGGGGYCPPRRGGGGGG